VQVSKPSRTAGTKKEVGMGTTAYAVEGMTCGHCVAAVSREVTRIEGVTGVQIQLVPEGVSRVEVESSARVDPTRVAAAVAEVGYDLTGVLA
jgi:copper chaperone CopZ